MLVDADSYESMLVGEFIFLKNYYPVYGLWKPLIVSVDGM